jgi:hypothetical protein
MVRKVNLVLFGHPHNGTLPTLVKVAELISARHPDIAAYPLSAKQRVGGTLRLLPLAARPTLSIELARPRVLPPFRGHRLLQLGRGLRDPGISKMEEFRRLEAIGLPVPKWTEIGPDTKLDPDEWGPYVVVKPSVGGHGYNVIIRKTARTRFKPPEEHEAGSLGRLGPMIAQEFIYTGRRPESIRVLTFLGHPINAIRYFGHSQPNELPGRFAFKNVGGHDIVAFDRGGKIELVDDPEAVELARLAHRAFPNVPALGVDIVRDADTGRAYVIETNPQGPHWTLVTPGAGMRYEPGVDRNAQFGAIDVIAEASAEAARRLAR